MSQIREGLRAIQVSLLFWLITAVVYPLIIFLCGQFLFPFQAQGSFLKNSQGQVVASALIGQPFRGDRYFWSRPSAVDYSTGKAAGDTGVSGASNFAPSNPALLPRIQEQVKTLMLAQIPPSADLVYSSGSGLDPHIGVAAARNQIPRIAQTRNRDPNELEILIHKATEGRFLGIFGEPGVNVAKLNLSLDQNQ
ncbi:MAG: K(+)-transporting ATPase subunit C [Cyanobacteria bacterium RI_101]|nr:K(+)-transporting ATPase subunit C [Cyanobacteria bacterium RI_101]